MGEPNTVTVVNDLIFLNGHRIGKVVSYSDYEFVLDRLRWKADQLRAVADKLDEMNQKGRPDDDKQT